MKLIELCITRPVAVLAAVMMVLLLGWLALYTIPIQLTPDVRKPLIQVWTWWPGAAPAEVEREIINRQEEALKGLEGLERMESSARAGRGSINLEFNIDVNRDRVLLLINNRLSQIQGMPDDAREPQIRTRDSEDNPIAYFVVRPLEGNARPVTTYGSFLEDVVQDRLERIDGVAVANIFGADKRELRVIVEPRRLAQYGLTIPDIATALRGTSVNISAGDLDEGKRSYIVRTESELNTIDRVKQVVLRTVKDPKTGRIARVTVDDIADVDFGLKKRSARIRNLGEEAVIVNTVRDTGANVIEVMDEIKRVVAELNEGSLKNQGLMLQQVHDDTLYINSAISLVNQNIFVGGFLAAMILMLFLRSWRATAVVTLAIPISIIGSFVAMAALGRSINVISLAGIAFAVGMVVDAAIVVLENIYRHRELGRSRYDAAFRGAAEVWGAILASALTTVVVFAPILVMDLVVGQLFRDIAVALSVAVMLSLVVAITVIPTLANKLLGEGVGDAHKRFALPGLDHAARGFVQFVLGLTRLTTRNHAAGLAVILVVCGIAGLSTWLFLPKLEYLPNGNRNLMIARISPPPGYNLATTNEMAQRAEARVRPYWASVTGPEPAPDGTPKMERFWFIAFTNFAAMTAAAVDPTRARDLMPILRSVAFGEPGTSGFISQASLFGRGLGGSKSIDIDITGPDLEKLMELARETARQVDEFFPRSEGHFARYRPGLQLGAPEVRLTPDLTRLSDNGLSARDFGVTIDAFNDGLRVSEITVGNQRMDLTLMGPESHVSHTQGIGNLPVVTRTGLVLPASSLANINVTEGPTEIMHLERERTVQVQVRPSDDISLEEAIDRIEKNIIAPLEAAGLPAGTKISMSGTANDLNQTWSAMQLNLMIAVAVVFLVMAILFESFVYPLIIVLSVPLATAGGVAGLLLAGERLDMLSLLGFVILIGTVVNNAILLVHQSLHHMRDEGMEMLAAIEEATRNRIRPIFMSTLTSCFGMLPLVVFPGAGSELYRGLGSVVVGGLALSAVLTLLIIPPLLSMVASLVERPRAAGAPAVSPAE